jgi:hypothetical protein
MLVRGIALGQIGRFDMTSTATAVSIGTPTRSLAGLLKPYAPHMDYALVAGYEFGRYGAFNSLGDWCRGQIPDAIVTVRAEHGFVPRYAPLLTSPDAQHKLAMGKVPSFGLTLASADMSGHEACSYRTWACTQVCVVKNGNGRYDSVQRAWLWRTALLTESPVLFSWQHGYELGCAVRRYGRILERPNVNSDIPWYRITPSLGSLPDIGIYDYTKSPAVLREGFTAPGFTLAYSWNENSDIGKVRAYLARGGHVAIVTDRKRGHSVDANGIRRSLGVGRSVRVMDADVTDEWIIRPNARGTVGDLTAKGKARSLVGRSRFVLTVGEVL